MLASLGTARANAGTLEHHRFRSPVLGREWAVNVYRPAAPAAAGYPVLYLLHGHGGNENDWAVAGEIVRTADSLIAGGWIPPTLIVMPDGGNGWWVDGPEKFETAFFEDLIPYAERTWHAAPRRERRLVAGLSMGGYGALRFALGHPESFAAAALLSPAIYDPAPPANSGARHAGVFGTKDFDEAAWKSRNWPAIIDAYLAKKTPVPMYIVAGDDDGFRLERDALTLYERLRDARQPAELRIEDGGHDWPLWSAAIGEALPWMCRYVKTPAGATP